MDTHVHSHASDKPVVAALGLVGCPECYSPPEKVYDQAMARGMDLVTITDHDTIEGALELANRGFPHFVIGQEVTARFPEDGCKLHVLVWGLTPDLAEQITALGLRDDVYKLAHWIRENNLAHALAHPLYAQNGRLTLAHVERCAVLFRNFETLNTAHAGAARDPLERFVDSLTPERIANFAQRHELRPLWPETWRKGRTGGSDDHALLNIGRAWTQVVPGKGARGPDTERFLDGVVNADCTPGGVSGDAVYLAHQITAVAAQYLGRRVVSRARPSRRLMASKLLAFAGVRSRAPSKVRVAASSVGRRVRRKVLRRPKRDSLPVTTALRHSFQQVLDRFPDLRDRLRHDAWRDGPALGEHLRMAAFMSELTRAVAGAMEDGAMDALEDRDFRAIADHVVSYALLHATQVPYIVGLFQHNQDRPLIERLEHQLRSPGEDNSPLARPMRVLMFTDTLGDVNGVSRFVLATQEQANARGADLRVVASTRRPAPPIPGVHNFEPLLSLRLPRYEDQEIVLPPIVDILRLADQHQPDVVHISTPGPVGALGLIAGRMLRVPIVGVHHTDFPAYAERLFDDASLKRATVALLRAFYVPFDAVFTRSEAYIPPLEELGVSRDRVRSFLPGVDTDAFHPRADDDTWRRLGIKPASFNLIYVGRVSAEKNLALLARVWKAARKQLRLRGIDATLIVVGDGPYREKFQNDLEGHGAQFTGFIHGDDLAGAYAAGDLLAFPSVTDTLGQVVLEAMASGTPALVTDEGGPQEVVDHRCTGLVLPAADERAWIDAIVSLATDRARLSAMGAAAHAGAQSYSLDAAFEDLWNAHLDVWRHRLREIGIRETTPLVPQ
jgi:glycosyltransferase involved in cell wall biosynthesis/predicted metal-dependent phosphoesterase TrpH